MDVAYWTHNEQDKLQLLNLRTTDDPKLIKLNANLNPQLTTNATSLFKEYRDVFAFSYEDLRGIPEHIATHRIELDTAISPCHQARYRMNPNYAKAVKEDLEKLLKAGFIESVDQATWLSPIVVVPKKNGKLRIFVDFRHLNATTKKDLYPLPFTDEVLDIVIGYAAYSFIDCFFRLSPSPHSCRQSAQDRLHYRMGRICMGSDAFWFEKCSTDIPGDRQPDLQGLSKRLYEVVCGRL